MHSRDQLSRASKSRALAETSSTEISKEQLKHIISETVKLIKGFDDRILSVDTYAQKALDLDSLDGVVSTLLLLLLFFFIFFYYGCMSGHMARDSLRSYRSITWAHRIYGFNFYVSETARRPLNSD